jgi:uncharacterized protein involved in exopolysaccharide biosynthesis
MNAGTCRSGPANERLMTNNHERPFEELRGTLGEYARIFCQRWRLGLVALSLVASAAFWYSQYLPRTYRVSTLFERRDDAVLRNLIQSSSPYSFDNLKSTLAMDMTGSRAMAEAAVSLGLLSPETVPAEGALSADATRAVDKVLQRHRLSAAVRMLQTSASLDAIGLDVSASDPEIAQRFTVALRDRYISETRARISGILLNTKQFFETELQRAEQQVAQVDRELRSQFDEFPGVNPNDVSSAGAYLEDLRQERARLAEHRAELEAQITAREQFLVVALAREEELSADLSVAAAKDGTAIPPPPELDEATARAVAQVELELRDALTVKRMTEAHPIVKALRRKLAEIYASRTPPAGQPTTTAPAVAGTSARSRFGPERLRVELELNALRRQFEITQGSHQVAEQRTERFAKLYEQLIATGQHLRGPREKLDQDTAAIGMWRQHVAQLNRILSAENEQRGTQFVLIEEPRNTDRPISPRVGSVFAVCSGSGLAMAILLMALAELLDRSFRTAGQVTRVLGVPVLESVGVIPTPQVRRRRMISRLIWTPALGLLIGALLTVGALAYVSLEQPTLHRRAVARLDGVLHSLGMPQASLVEPHEE